MLTRKNQSCAILPLFNFRPLPLNGCCRRQGPSRAPGLPFSLGWRASLGEAGTGLISPVPGSLNLIGDPSWDIQPMRTSTNLERYKYEFGSRFLSKTPVDSWSFMMRPVKFSTGLRDSYSARLNAFSFFSNPLD